MSYAVSKNIIDGTLYVRFDDGRVKSFNVVELGRKWFRMSNYNFYRIYGFNWTPHEDGVYEKIKDLVEKEEEE